MSAPSRRNAHLVVQSLDGELLIFDELADRAHSLNASAAAVWEACDGTRDRDALCAATGLEALAVDLALESLAQCDLLIGYEPPVQRVSRRAALRKAALTGVGLGLALPVVRSVKGPNAEAAASTCGGSNNCGKAYPGGCGEPGNYFGCSSGCQCSFHPTGCQSTTRNGEPYGLLTGSCRPSPTP